MMWAAALVVAAVLATAQAALPLPLPLPLPLIAAEQWGSVPAPEPASAFLVENVE